MTTAVQEMATPLAWSFQDALRRAVLARLGERMMSTRWSITPNGRAALGAEGRAA